MHFFVGWTAHACILGLPSTLFITLHLLVSRQVYLYGLQPQAELRIVHVMEREATLLV